MDSSKNLYIVGLSMEPSTVQRVFLTKYDTTGNFLWKKLFIDSVYSFCDAKLLTIDDSANIYITGYTAHSSTMTGYDCIVIKYDSTGLLKWFQVYTISGNNNWESPLAINYGKKRISITGRLELNAGANPADLFFLSYDTQGNLLFSDTLNGPGNAPDFGNDVVIDSLGNSYVTGLISDSNYVRQIIVMYDSLGQRTSLNSRPANSQGFKIILDNENNLYTCGSYADTNHMNFYGAIVKYFLDLSTSVPEIHSQSPEIYIFPNPFINSINVFCNDSKYSNTSIKIYDFKGSQIKFECENLENHIKINTENILSGIYFIEVQSENNILKKLLLKF